MRNKLLLFLIILVVFTSGCIENIENILRDLTGGGGIEIDGSILIKAVAEPSNVFAGSTTRVYVDVENTDTKTLKDVNIDLYYTGLLSNTDPESCKKHRDELEPGEFMMHSCELGAPGIDEIATSSVSTDVGVSVKFSATFSEVQKVEMVTEEEYELRKNTGEWKTYPKSYTYSDKNIELQVDFSDKLPIIVREGKKAYIHFTIKNIGGGFISDIEEGDFTVSSDVIKCGNIKLSMIGDSFPRITCELELPQGITYLSNRVVIISINYDYEKRRDVPVTILR